MNEHINIKVEATNIIVQHTDELIKCGTYNPNDSHELYDFMVDHCSRILVGKLLSKEFTPMQFNAIRDEVAHQLFDCFIDHL